MTSSNEYKVPNRAETPNMKRNIIERLEVLWLANPELRLSQLWGNAFPLGQDTYYIEDYDLINRMEKHYENEPQ